MNVRRGLARWGAATLAVVALSGCGAVTHTPATTGTNTAATACRLPVSWTDPSMAVGGGFITYPDGAFKADPAAVGLRTPFGVEGSAYDAPAGKWVPVARPNLTPDGQTYVYGTLRNGLEYHAVNVASGTDVTLSGYDKLYYEVGLDDEAMYGMLGGSLWRIPLSGMPAITRVGTGGYWVALDGGGAWGWDSQSAPLGASRVLRRLDVTRLFTQDWATLDGASTLLGFDADGTPVVAAGGDVWLVPLAPAAKVRIASQFTVLKTTTSENPLPVVGDRAGIWLPASDGIYLYSGGHLQKVSSVQATPAGPCLSAGTQITITPVPVATATPSLAASLGTITEFPIPTAGSQPYGITLGPDGNLWFTELRSNRIGRITSAGVITEYRIPTPDSYPVGIAAGPDGNLWFTESNVNQIGRITTSGVISEFSGMTGQGRIGQGKPNRIVAGHDGNLWFTEAGDTYGGSTIGRITPAGVISEFSTEAVDTGVLGITAGPDGNIWFTEFSARKVGKITPDGQITEYPVPGGTPSDITTGPDGALWVVTGSLVRVTTSGSVQVVGSISAPGPLQLTMGADGALWFVGFQTNAINRMTTTGVASSMAIPTANSSPFAITAGPASTLWFVEEGGNKVGRLAPAP